MTKHRLEIYLHNLEETHTAIIPTNYVEFYVEPGNHRVLYTEDGGGMWEISWKVGLNKHGWEYEGEIYDICGVNHRGWN
tara:strand:+ start:509 stop:745 length:237 start_codon:yes stop_codon:yes gene_type:complete